MADAGVEGSRAEAFSEEIDPRRDAEGAGCGVALLSFWNETTEDARESDGMTEGVPGVVFSSFV